MPYKTPLQERIVTIVDSDVEDFVVTRGQEWPSGYDERIVDELTTLAWRHVGKGRYVEGGPDDTTLLPDGKYRVRFQPVGTHLGQDDFSFAEAQRID